MARGGVLDCVSSNADAVFSNILQRSLRAVSIMVYPLSSFDALLLKFSFPLIYLRLL